MKIKLPDGTILEAPDGSDPSVVAKGYLAKKNGAAITAPPAPKPPGGPWTPGMSYSQSVLSNFGDEAGAAIRATAIAPFSKKTWGEAYGEQLASLRAEMEASKQNTPAALRIPAAVAGAVQQGGAAALGRLTLLRSATSIPKALGLGAVEGAAYGGLAGAGEGATAEERLKGAGYGAATGAAVGSTLSGVAAAFLGKTKIPEIDDLLTAKTAAYKAAEDSGVVINQSSAQNALQTLRAALGQAKLSPRLHPKTTGVLADITEDIQKGPMTFSEADQIHKLINDVLKSGDAEEQRVALILRDGWDNFVDGLKQADVSGPDPKFAIEALNEGRSLYRRANNAQIVQDLIEKAATDTQKSATGSMERALSNTFATFVKNKDNLRRFSPREREAIRRVARGGNYSVNITRLFRIMGSVAPRGPVSGMALMAGTHYGGPTVGATMFGVGEVGRAGASILTRRNAALADQLMRRGGPAPPIFGANGPQVTGEIAGAGTVLREVPDQQKKLAEMLRREKLAEMLRREKLAEMLRRVGL